MSKFSSLHNALRYGLAEINPWYALDVIKAGWNGADHMLLSNTDLHHKILDVGVSSLKSFRGSWPGMYYRRGFGDVAAISSMLHELKTKRFISEDHKDDCITPLQQVVLSPSIHGRKFASVLEGSYKPPGRWMPHLPPESAVGRFQLVTPTAWAGVGQGGPEAREAQTSGSPEAVLLKEMCDIRPIMVLLAGTGEHGFRRRRHCLAYPLARLGIATLSVEIPFYGSRRPGDQPGSKLATLVDLPVQGCAVIEETRSLLAWLAHQPALPQPTLSSCAAESTGLSSCEAQVKHPSSYTPSTFLPFSRRLHGDGYGAVVLGGTSMGGLHAAMTACTLPESMPVGIASWLGPPSASAVYIQGRLAHCVDWSALATHAVHPVRGPALEEGLEDVRTALDGLEWRGAGRGMPFPIPRTPIPSAHVTRAIASSFKDVDYASLRKAHEMAAILLQSTDLLNFGRPARPDAAVFVTATSDQYVPSSDEAIQSMWASVRTHWPGVQVRCVRGGHVSASLFALDSFGAMAVEVVRKVAGKA